MHLARASFDQLKKCFFLKNIFLIFSVTQLNGKLFSWLTEKYEHKLYSRTLHDG